MPVIRSKLAGFPFRVGAGHIEEPKFYLVKTPRFTCLVDGAFRSEFCLRVGATRRDLQ